VVVLAPEVGELPEEEEPPGAGVPLGVGVPAKGALLDAVVCAAKNGVGLELPGLGPGIGLGVGLGVWLGVGFITFALRMNIVPFKVLFFMAS
jgi:hypothetical protein